MSLSRRHFLRLSGLTAVITTASACSALGQELARQELPEILTLPPADTAVVDPVRRFLNRAGFGPQPGDIARVQAMGLAAYLEEQLHPDEIDDTAADLLRRSQTLAQMDVSQLIEQDKEDATIELIGGTLQRALTSKRQLYEAMVEFWSDHFNIYLRKNEMMPLLKLVDDRDVIRSHALGKFRELLFASARSPAMLVYLDNVRNTKEQPNENYARELLELHTLGVDAGYTQKDVQEVARILTGWTVAHRGRRKGTFTFAPEQHDFGRKTVLGQTFQQDDGEAEVAALLEMLVAHPATAVFIATKLVRRFVADEPPPALVAQVAHTYRQTDGDIKAMLRVLFLSDEFAAAPPKLKRPVTYLISLLRALHASLRLGRGREIGRILEQLGQPPFYWPPPDGYPDVSSAWSANLLPRWNLALALAHDELPGVAAPWQRLIEAGGAQTVPAVLNLFAGLVYGRGLTAAETTAFINYVGSGTLSDPTTRQKLRDSVGLMLASPAFQWT